LSNIRAVAKLTEFIVAQTRKILKKDGLTFLMAQWRISYIT
jgi:hypothetical protein